jgi:hypothetical protein
VLTVHDFFLSIGEPLLVKYKGMKFVHHPYVLLAGLSLIIGAMFDADEPLNLALGGNAFYVR